MSSSNYSLTPVQAPTLIPLRITENLLMQQPEIQAAAANIAASVLNSFTKRSYLADTVKQCRLEINHVPDSQLPSDTRWLKLKQVGISEQLKTREYWLALERLLQSAHVPDKHRLLFLLSCENGRTELRLGLQSLSVEDDGWTKRNLSGIADFASANWPGLVLEPEADSGECNRRMQKLLSQKHCGITALTGLPSIRGENRDAEAVTLDKLAGAMHHQNWAYLVIAEPLSDMKLEELLTRFRDLAGRAESMKSMQISEGHSTTKSSSQSVSDSTSTSSSDSSSEGKHQKKDMLMSLLPLAVTLAASHLGGPFAELLCNGNTLDYGKVLMFGSLINPVIGSFKSNQSSSSSLSDGTSHSISVSDSLAEGTSRNISRNIVDKTMEAAVASLNAGIERLEQFRAQGAWNVGAYFIGENPNISDLGGRMLKSLLSGKDSFHEPIRTHNLHFTLPSDEANLRMQIIRGAMPDIRIRTAEGAVMEHPLGALYSQLTTPLGSRELSQFMNFPTAPIPGIEVLRVPEEASQQAWEVTPGSIQLGNLVYSGKTGTMPYPVQLDQLTKHTLICGITGSGKSTTIRRLLHELMAHHEESRGAIPFLVIEPAKDEYVQWAMKINEKTPGAIQVFIPGRKEWHGHALSPFLLNPLDVVWPEGKTSMEVETVQRHLDQLKTIFSAALPMQEVLPILLDELLYYVYRVPLQAWSGQKEGDPIVYLRPDQGIDPANKAQAAKNIFNWLAPEFSRHPDMQRPTLAMMYQKIDHVIALKGYSDRPAKDLRAALSARMLSFIRGWKGDVLNCGRLPRDHYKNLFDKPTVINLTGLGDDDDKCFFMALLMQFLYEYRQACHENDDRDYSNTLRHLLVVEEAHRILGHESAVNEGNQARSKLASAFSAVLSEIRAYGEGILLADQVPGRLHPDALKNTNLKIIHRLVSGDDRDAMKNCMDLKESHARLLGSLKPGFAMVRGDMDNEPAWIKINPPETDSAVTAVIKKTLL